MNGGTKAGQRPIYDRDLLLGGAKRNTLLELWEVQRYGIDSYGDADYVCLYGMQPAQWYSKGLGYWGERRSNAREMRWLMQSART